MGQILSKSAALLNKEDLKHFYWLRVSNLFLSPFCETTPEKQTVDSFSWAQGSKNMDLQLCTLLQLMTIYYPQLLKRIKWNWSGNLILQEEEM